MFDKILFSFWRGGGFPGLQINNAITKTAERIEEKLKAPFRVEEVRFFFETEKIRERHKGTACFDSTCLNHHSKMASPITHF